MVGLGFEPRQTGSRVHILNQCTLLITPTPVSDGNQRLLVLLGAEVREGQGQRAGGGQGREQAEAISHPELACLFLFELVMSVLSSLLFHGNAY